MPTSHRRSIIVFTDHVSVVSLLSVFSVMCAHETLTLFTIFHNLRKPAHKRNQYGDVFDGGVE